MAENAPGRRGVYYGWYMVITAMFISAVTTGARNGFGVFVIPMSEDFQWDRTTIASAAAIGMLMNGVSQPVLGYLFDKFDSRRVILISLAIVGLATAAISATNSWWFLVVMFGFVLSVAISGASIGTMGPLLARWFVRRRTLVLGLAAAGASLGGPVLLPFTASLVEWFHWRVSWVALGAIVTVVALPLAFSFLRNDPERMGLRPDGDPAPSSGGDGSPVERQRGLFEVDQWWHSLKSPPIWNLSAAYTVCGVTVGVISVHFVPYAQEQIGVSLTRASLIFGYLTGLNVVGAIGGGWLADRFGRKNVLGTVYFVRGIAYATLLAGMFAVENNVVLPVIGTPGEASLWIFATLAGFSWIASVPITTSLTAEVYGLRALATISGISFLCHQIGSFVSILLAAALYDLTGSYFLPFAIAGSLLIPASISAFTINEKKYSVRYQSAPAPVPAGGS